MIKIRYLGKSCRIAIVRMIQMGFSFFGLNIKISSQQKSKNRIFLNRSLKFNEDGYWTVEPPITSIELDQYYLLIYWDLRGGKLNGTNIRDHVHFEILSHYLGAFLSVPRTVLNFGAGHGGISHLLWLAGHNVINVEPSGLRDFYSERWKTFKVLDEVPDFSIELVYGSHSLEHVPDLTDFLKLLKTKIRSNAYVFWEVPNADAPGNGPVEGKIVVPHTYYFQKSFFDKEFSRIIMNETFKSRNEVSNWEEYIQVDGNVIRVIGAYDIPVGKT